MIRPKNLRKTASATLIVLDAKGLASVMADTASDHRLERTEIIASLGNYLPHKSIAITLAVQHLA